MVAMFCVDDDDEDSDDDDDDDHLLFSLQRQFLISSCKGSLPGAGSGPSQAEWISKIQKYSLDQVRNIQKYSLD